MTNLNETKSIAIVKTFTHVTKSELYKELTNEQKEIILSLLERRGVYFDNHNGGDVRNCDAFAIWKRTSHKTGDSRIEITPVYDALPFCINPFILEQEGGVVYAALSTSSCGGIVQHNTAYPVDRSEHWEVGTGFLPETIEFHIIRPKFFLKK